MLTKAGTTKHSIAAQSEQSRGNRYEMHNDVYNHPYRDTATHSAKSVPKVPNPADSQVLSRRFDKHLSSIHPANMIPVLHRAYQ